MSLVISSELLQPSIFPFGIRIDEPVTTLTDLIVSAVCLYAFFSLRKLWIPHRVYLLFRGFFLFMGLATLLGGILGHGFLYAFDDAWKFPGWAFSMLAINLIERVMITYSRPYLQTGFTRFFSWLNIIELLLFATLAFTTLEFLFVEIHTAYGLLIFVFSFSLFHYIRGNDRTVFKWFLGGVLAVAVSDFFFLTEISISRWFNHIDISHILLALAAWLFYMGARRMIPVIHHGNLHR